ncbi:Hs2st [Bugula neritina]|uniref:Hs2st n=1 Tax=Bugula neritina TaxID=10212 RepID=A0A7J7J8Z4_BUGNE|nr:Hs2st [Bugula neritina]
MMWMQVPFFCGQHAQCLIPGPWALEQAKSNLANHFLLVGLTEQLGEFVALLETMLPRYFSGAYELYTNSKLGHLRKTKDKIAPSKETVRIIKESLIYQLEHELYEFAKEQFNFLKQRALKIDENERAIIMKPLFKYEKIV